MLYDLIYYAATMPVLVLAAIVLSEVSIQLFAWMTRGMR